MGIEAGLDVGANTTAPGLGTKLAGSALKALPGIGGKVASKQFSDLDTKHGFSRKAGKALGVGKNDVRNVGKVASGFIGGAATGSVVPGVGTLAGGIIGAAAGLLDIEF